MDTGDAPSMTFVVMAEYRKALYTITSKPRNHYIYSA